MALYDLSSDIDLQRCIDRLNKGHEKGVYAELIIKSKPITEDDEKTQKQNAYIHVCFAYFGDFFGYSADYVKRNIFKLQVNPELFVIKHKDRYGREWSDLRSFSDLSYGETKQAIDKWCMWCLEVADFPMPDHEDKKVIDWIKSQHYRQSKL